MYSYCVRYVSVDYVNFCVTVILFALLGAQTKESSLSCFAPTPTACLDNCSAFGINVCL